jgi:hypothetical protein
MQCHHTLSTTANKTLCAEHATSSSWPAAAAATTSSLHVADVAAQPAKGKGTSTWGNNYSKVRSKACKDAPADA